MCRLLGVIANKPVDLEFSLTKFRKYASCNIDGWGIGWYVDGKPEVFKEKISAQRSEQFPILSKEVCSRIIISHVRLGSRGVPSEHNSHPFKFGKWIFAHNGTVDREHLLSNLDEKYKREIRGETDSEVYFYWILQCIEESGDVVEGIKKALKRVMEVDYSGLNFLLSDGSSLYALRYSDKPSKDYSLYWLRRDPSESGVLEGVSHETKALIRSKMLKSEKAVLICSEKLTKKEGWKAIELGTLLKIDSKLKVDRVKIM